MSNVLASNINRFVGMTGRPHSCSLQSWRSQSRSLCQNLRQKFLRQNLLCVAQTELGEASNRITEAQDDTMRQRRAECTAAMTNQPQVQRQSPDHTHAIGVVDQSGRTPSLFTVPNQSDTRDVENDSENAGRVFGYSICGDSVGTSVHEDPQSQSQSRKS